MKLDIGCGGRGSRFTGFLGVDIAPRPAVIPHGTDYLQLDFIRGALPWPDRSVEEIVCLHVIEHLPRADGAQLLRRINRLLAPGARATVTCPDLKRLCERYLAGDWQFWDAHYDCFLPDGIKPLIWPGLTLADRLNWAIHQQGHIWCYDLVSLISLAHEAGIVAWAMEPGNPYNTRADHETGIIFEGP